MIDIKTAREELARLHAETTELMNFAGELTPDQEATKDRNFARMEQLNKKIADEEALAKAAFEKGGSNVQFATKPKAQIDYERSEGIYNPTFRPNRSGGAIPLSKDMSFAEAIGCDRDNDRPYSLGSLCRAMVMGATNEYERFALQSSSDSASGYEISADLAAEMIDKARMQSVFVNAGATTVPLGNVGGRILTLADIVEPQFRAENSSVHVDQTLGAATLEPKTIAVILKVSREQLEDSLNGATIIEQAFASAFGAELDRVLGWGTGGDEPTGVFSTSGVSEVAHNAEITDYTSLLNALYELQVKNFQPTSVIMSPREYKAFNALTDQQDQPLRRPPSLENLPFGICSIIPEEEGLSAGVESSMLMADFRHLWVGIRAGLRIEVLKELYAEAGLQYGFLAHLRVDSALAQPKAFVKVSGVMEA